MRGGLRVAVVGGSVAGCATAAALVRAGHRVSVHERASGPLTGRGIGVVADPGALQRLVGHGLIDRDVPRVDADVVRYVHRSPGGEVCRIGDAVVATAACYWSALHHELRRRVPEAAWVTGHEVAAGFAGADIRLEGLADICDLIVFADGHRSPGRRLVAPEAELEYRGLVVWWGLVPEHEVDARDLTGALTRVLYRGGHGVVYLTPGPSGSTAPGERLVTWGFSLPVGPDELGAVLTGRDGRRHATAVALGDIDDGVAATLRARLEPLVPRRHLDLVDRSRATSLEAVRTVEVERPHRARACLVGDAAAVLPPFGGSGVLKALGDATSLRIALDRAATVGEALAGWAADHRRTVQTARGIALRTERELVHRIPDLAAMGAAEKHRWLAMVHYGEEVLPWSTGPDAPAPVVPPPPPQTPPAAGPVDRTPTAARTGSG